MRKEFKITVLTEAAELTKGTGESWPEGYTTITKRETFD